MPSHDDRREKLFRTDRRVSKEIESCRLKLARAPLTASAFHSRILSKQFLTVLTPTRVLRGS